MRFRGKTMKVLSPKVASMTLASILLLPVAFQNVGEGGEVNYDDLSGPYEGAWNVTFDPPPPHAAFIGDMPNELNVGITGGQMFIGGDAPFVDVTGTIDTTTGDFFLSGQGTVAGFPDIFVTFNGNVSPPGALNGDYDVGVEGGLPTGHSTTYSYIGNLVTTPDVPPPPGVQIQFERSSYNPSDTGALIDIVAPAANLDPNSEDRIQVRVWSDTDPEGVVVFASETGGINSGEFLAAVGFTTEDPDSTTTLRISPGDTVWAAFGNATTSATIATGPPPPPTPGAPGFFFDREIYDIGRVGELRLDAPGLNTDPEVLDTTRVRLSSDTFTEGRNYLMTETDRNTALFRTSFALTDDPLVDQISFVDALLVSPGDTITAEHDGLFATAFVSSVGVPPPVTPPPEVTPPPPVEGFAITALPNFRNVLQEELGVFTLKLQTPFDFTEDFTVLPEPQQQAGNLDLRLDPPISVYDETLNGYRDVKLTVIPTLQSTPGSVIIGLGITYTDPITGDLIMLTDLSQVTVNIGLAPPPVVADDVMTTKVQQAAGILTTPGMNGEVYTAAVDEALEGLFVSNLVVLPTAGVPETIEGFASFEQLMEDALRAFSVHVDKPKLGTGESKAAALEARNFLQVTREAMQVIGEQTALCDTSDFETCDQLAADDEGGTIDIVKGFAKHVRSPFYLNLPLREPVENIIAPGDLRVDECAAVLKETKGMLAVVRPVKIPIWVEPWYARAKIVGFQTVWVWEFVPAEFLKTISYCNVDGRIVMDVDTEVVRERLLMHFWRFYANVP